MWMRFLLCFYSFKIERSCVHFLKQPFLEQRILVIADLVAHHRMRDAFVEEHFLRAAHGLQLLRKHQRAALVGVASAGVAAAA